MNNIFFALCFLFILTCFSHAQNKTIYLKDSESKEPIAYATIVGSGDFIYSDFDGSFEINRVDSLIISHVNYGVQVILFESHTNDSIIYLKQIVNVLEEVIVSKTKMLGCWSGITLSSALLVAAPAAACLGLTLTFFNA